MTYEWQDMNFNTIIGGVAPDGVLYLKTFLIDYKYDFNVEAVNPSCQKCLREYHNEFIKKYKVMNTECNYRLRKKREGVVVPFTGIRVNNNNLTDELAEKLLTKWEASYLFDVYPKEEKKEKQTIVVPETITFQKKKKKNR